MSAHPDQLLLDATERAVRYRTETATRPVFPTETSVNALGGLTGELPDGPRDAQVVLEQLDELASPATVVSGAGRYFGFVNGGTEPVAQAAAVLVGAWDQNVALPVMSPAAAELDATAARWVCELLGLPDTALATFCSGASIANLTCILAARDALLHRAGWSVDGDGLAGAPPIEVVASAEIHVSVNKALRAAGIGRASVTQVPVDACGRMVASAMPALGERSLVLVQAGNVNTGHSDPFGPIIERARAAGAWVHVDGAFGLWAAASPDQGHLVDGVDGADSWATDAHKWLNAPYDSGLAICARPEDLRRAMSFDAAYLATDSKRALAHLGLQMSQRARGVEAWAILATRGRTGVAGLVDQLCDLAALMAQRLSEAGVEVLVPQALNQVLVGFGSDAVADRTIEAIQADGRIWLGGTTWQGRKAGRISICDAATSRGDIERACEVVIEAWQSVRPS